jgi:hypothetical protein
MMIVTDSRIESRWNWYSQSKPAVCFNGFRDARAKQYRSSKHSNYRSKANQDLVEFPPTPQLQVLRFTSKIHRHISMPIRQAAVERFSPIHF